MSTKNTFYNDWSWNNELFLSKIGISDANGCVGWLGSTGPITNLFGVHYHGKPRMIQARRILFMMANEPNMEEKSVAMRCGNRYCMNKDHMELEPNRRLNLTMPEKVQPGFVETRISIERFNELDEEQTQELKELTKQFNVRVNYDFEFNYYAMTWNRNDWLLAKIKEPELTEKLTLVRRRLDGKA